MRAWWRLLAALALVWIGASAAQAEDPPYFPAENFGKANKRFSETSANIRMDEVLMGRSDVFESVFDFEAQDPFRLLGRAVGLLDLRTQERDGAEGNRTCTATLIGPGRR